MSRFFRILCMAFFILPIAGCLTLQSNEPPPATYVLHPRFADNSQPKPQSALTVLEIPPPEVPSGFDTDRIALYWDKGRRLDYYSAAKWPAPLDQLMGDFLIRSASQTLPGATVVSPDLSLPAQYRLAVKIMEFQPVYKGEASGIPDLYTSARFSLVTLPDEKILTDFVLSDYTVPSGDDLTAITSGLESALQNLTVKAFDRIAPLIAPKAAEPQLLAE